MPVIEGNFVNSDGNMGIKLIYIDPPYATGDDYQAPGKVYAFSAKLVGAPYLEFLRKRLMQTIKRLLTIGITRLASLKRQPGDNITGR